MTSFFLLLFMLPLITYSLVPIKEMLLILIFERHCALMVVVLLVLFYSMTVCNIKLLYCLSLSYLIPPFLYFHFGYFSREISLIFGSLLFLASLALSPAFSEYIWYDTSYSASNMTYNSLQLFLCPFLFAARPCKFFPIFWLMLKLL